MKIKYDDKKVAKLIEEDIQSYSLNPKKIEILEKLL